MVRKDPDSTPPCSPMPTSAGPITSCSPGARLRPPQGRRDLPDPGREGRGLSVVRRPWFELVGELPRRAERCRRCGGCGAQAGLDEAHACRSWPASPKRPTATSSSPGSSRRSRRRCAPVSTPWRSLPGAEDGTDSCRWSWRCCRLGDAKEEKPFARCVGKYLRAHHRPGEARRRPKRWAEWFAKTYPAAGGAAERARRRGRGGVAKSGWRRSTGRPATRSAASWSSPRRAVRRAIPGAALGPDLHGVAGRFSRDDLLTAILQPSKDISPRYRTTPIATATARCTRAW